MITANHVEAAAAFEPLRRLQTYREAVVDLAPELSMATLQTWTMSDADAFMSWLILDRLNADVEVLDIGTFVGASAFLFAAHPRVAGVVSVDPNPKLADEIGGSSTVRVLDVARAALDRFELETPVAIHEGGAAQLHLPESGRPILAYIDGLHTRDAVHADLASVFASERGSAALIGDCRYREGVYVQAGIAAFLEERPDFTFRLLADIATTTSALGIVYPSGSALGGILDDLASVFSGEWDVLQLLAREAELVAHISAKRPEQSALLRYRAADKAAQMVIGIPALGPWLESWAQRRSP